MVTLFKPVPADETMRIPCALPLSAPGPVIVNPFSFRFTLLIWISTASPLQVKLFVSFHVPAVVITVPHAVTEFVPADRFVGKISSSNARAGRRFRFVAIPGRAVKENIVCSTATPGELVVVEVIGATPRPN
jgi:hypothetical protein